jgi:hypothetical protein
MDERSEKKENDRKGALVGGLVLIVIGVLFLIAQFVDLGETAGVLVLPLLSAIFIIAGIVTRESGFFIPGGILAGLGLGTYLIVSSAGGRSGQDEGGLFLLAFAAGWVLIPILSILFSRGERHLWALIVAAIIGLVGAAVSFGGAALTALEALGRWWPLFLIAGGVIILWRRGLRR